MALQKTFNQRDFSSGQYDREYRSVHDEVTQRGMMYSRNLLSSVLGEVKTRPGFLHRLDLESRAAIIPYRYEGRDVMLVFQDGKLDLYEDNGGVTLDRFAATTPSAFSFPNTTSNNQGGVVLSDNSAGTTSTLYRVFTAAWANLSRIDLPRQSNFLYLATWDFGEKRAVHRFVAKIAKSLTGNQAEFTVQYWNEVFLQYSDDGVSWNTVRADVTPGHFRTVTGVGNRLISGARVIVREFREARYWRLGVRPNTNNLNSFSFFMSISDFFIATQTVPITIESPYSATDMETLKFDQSDKTLTICSERSLLPREFKIESGVPSFTEFNHVSFNQYGNPKCVRYFQNRRWFAGFDAYPTRVLGSAFGSFFDYTLPSQLTTQVSASPIVAEATQLKDRITNLYGGNNILYVTSHDGVSMIEAGGAIIGVNQINFLLKSDQRASDIPPIVRNNLMFLVSEDREKIYTLDFDLNTEKFVAPEISVYAKDILVNKIKELIDVDTREKLIYGLLDNGEMFAVLYENAPPKLGFFPIDTQGRFIDLARIKFEENNYLYAVVQRGSGYAIEHLQQVPKFMPTDEFGQTQADKNRITKFNLMDTFYFDSVRSMRNEIREIWEYDAERQVIFSESGTGTDLIPFKHFPIRFFISTDPFDYYEIEILGSLPNGEYSVEVKNIENAPSNIFMRFQTGFQVLQPVNPGDYSTVIRDTETETEVIDVFSQATPGTFSVAIPEDVVELEVVYAGANGRRGVKRESNAPWETTSSGGRGGVKQSRFEVIAGQVLEGAVGGIGDDPAGRTGTGGSGFTNGNAGQGVVTQPQFPPIGAHPIRASGGGGGGSTGFVYGGITYEAAGGGGGRGRGNLGQYEAISNGGNGGGIYGGIGGVSGYNSGGNATDPEQIGLQGTSATDGYITIRGWKRTFSETNFTLESETKLVPVGNFKLNNVLDPYVGTAMRFFPTESLLEYIDLQILEKDETDPENPYFVVEIIHEANLQFSAGMKFIIVRNSVVWNGTLNIVDTGRYVGSFTSENGLVSLPFPVYNIRYGLPYVKIGVIQENNSYLRKRKWGTVALNVMDTMSLQIGSRIDRLEDVMDFQIDEFYDASPIMRNGVVSRNIADDYEQDKILIFKTEEGLPFCIRAIEASGEITDRNTN